MDDGLDDKLNQFRAFIKDSICYVYARAVIEDETCCMAYGPHFWG